MIKANELRVGNLVFRDGLNIENGKWDALTIKINYQDIFNLINGNDIVKTAYNPIPLTEEWLVKFGAEVYEFDNGQANQYRIKNDLFVIRDGIICHYGTSVKLEYVHKLQNLYFDLRGEELEIKGWNNE